MPRQSLVSGFSKSHATSCADLLGMCNQLTAIRTFDAPVDVVYSAWTSSETLVAPVVDVDMDPTVGGRVRVSTGQAPSADLTGVFVTVEDQRRLVYTWRWGDAAEESLVDVLFHAVDDRTVVEVHHRGFVDSASYETHLAGWVSYFDGLARYV